MKIFISHARADRTIARYLTVYLYGLKTEGIDFWHRGLLEAGSDIAPVVEKHLKEAKLILLLVTSAAVADEDCIWERNFALDRRRTLRINVIPIVISRPYLAQDDPIRQIKPIKVGKWDDRNEREGSLLLLAEQISLLVKQQRSSVPWVFLVSSEADLKWIGDTLVPSLTAAGVEPGQIQFGDEDNIPDYPTLCRGCQLVVLVASERFLLHHWRRVSADTAAYLSLLSKSAVLVSPSSEVPQIVYSHPALSHLPQRRHEQIGDLLHRSPALHAVREATARILFLQQDFDQVLKTLHLFELLKSMHDQLHQVQVHYLMLLQHSDHESFDEIAVPCLRLIDNAVRALRETSQQLVALGESPPQGFAWIDALVMPDEALRDRQRLRGHVYAPRQAFSYYNGRLRAIARQLCPPPGISEIQRCLRDAGVHADTLAAIDQDSTQITRLQAVLMQQLEEHDRLQLLDDGLKLASQSMQDSPGDLELFRCTLAAAVAPLPESAAARRACTTIYGHIDSGDHEQLGQVFRSCLHDVTFRFDRADQALKSTCQRLREVTQRVLGALMKVRG